MYVLLFLPASRFFDVTARKGRALMDSPQNDHESVGSSASSDRERFVDGTAFHPAAKPDDWAAHFPFPTFARKRLGDDHEDQLLMRHRTLDDELSSDDENAGPPQTINAHPMSSDWNLRSEPFSVDRRQNTDYRPLTASSMLSPARSMKGHTLAIEELTALTSMSDLRHPSNGQLKMQHVDLSWMARRQNGRIVPPTVHLCLANLHAAIDAGDVTPSQILINSPRSSILIIRKGIELSELLRRPWAERRHKHQASFGSVSQMSVSDRRELAAEKSRQHLLERLENEYEDLCKEVDLEEILQFCRGYHAERPCSALRAVGNSSSATLSRPSSSALTRSRSMIMRDRFSSRVEHEASVLATKAYMNETRRNELIEKIHHRDETIKKRIALINEHHQHSIVRSRAHEETWFAKHDHSQKVAQFRQIVARERSRFRFDEAVRRQAEEIAQKQRFAEHVRKLGASGLSRTSSFSK